MTTSLQSLGQERHGSLDPPAKEQDHERSGRLDHWSPHRHGSRHRHRVQQLLPAMARGTSIVFVSSPAARASVGTLSAYGATKGAVGTLVTHFASALGERGIRVNAVAPGVVETDMSIYQRRDYVQASQ